MIDGGARQPGTAQVLTTSGSGITSTSGVTVISGGFPLSVEELLNPVPGLGFDFTHLAAINRDLDVRAFIDPVTQLRLALAERLLRESPVFGVSPFFGGEQAPVILESPQAPPVVVVQQPAESTRSDAAGASPARVETVASTPAPLTEAEEFVLVRHDGKVIFAVAFSQQGERIVYVTREGSRRSLGLNDLDADATERMNEERGNNVQLSR